MEKFDTIYIMLGHACNFRCKYCLQEGNSKIKNMDIGEIFYTFLDNYPYKKNTNLMFWGGEPLLYYHKVKEIIERYTGQYRFSIISNGSLLTEEMTDFFNRHEVHFVFSHDAHITRETRGVDMWEDTEFRRCFDKLKSKTINVTVTAHSRPLKEIFAFYPEQYEVNLNPMMNTSDTSISRELAAFDAQKYKEDIQYLLKSAEEGKRRESRNVQKILRAIERFVTEKEVYTFRCYDCTYGAKALNIDLEGNVYLCHNSDVKIGTVETSAKLLRKNFHDNIKKTYTECATCKWSEICTGHCVLLKGYGRKQQCKRLDVLYTVIDERIREKVGIPLC